MKQTTEPTPESRVEPAPANTRIAFERLRERTDELELIVSGLLAFALLTVPDVIFGFWAKHSAHVEGFLESALMFTYMFTVSLSYTLAVTFIIHLAIRGYWIGLIGLKSTFPEGIRWDSLPMSGPISRRFYRNRVVDLWSAIERADRAASILFAVAVLIALTMAWATVLIVAMMLVGALIGWMIGDVERITLIALLAIYGVFMLGTLMVLVVDGFLVMRRPQLQDSPLVRRFVETVLKFIGSVMPQRIILPVQMTLLSNMPGRRYLFLYFAVSFVAAAMGGVIIAGSRQFAPFNNYTIVTTAAVNQGMLSAHYETLRSENDRLLRYPMIQADRIAEAHLRVFIPHQPQFDNALAKQVCPQLDGGLNQAQGVAARDAAMDCLSRMWAVTLDGQAVAINDFVPIERRDLGMRGIVGYLPLTALAPGRHDLLLVWNSDGESDGRLRRREYRIPFWFTPGIEQGL